MASPFPNASALRLVLADIDAGVKNAIKSGGIEEYIKLVKGKVKQLFEAQKLGIFREVFEEFGTFLWSVIVEYRTAQKQKTFDRETFLATYRLKLQVLEASSKGSSGSPANARIPADARVPASARVFNTTQNPAAAARVPNAAQVPAPARVSDTQISPAAQVPASARVPSTQVPTAGQIPAASRVPAATQVPATGVNSAVPQTKHDGSALVARSGSGSKREVAPTTSAGGKVSSSARAIKPLPKTGLPQTAGPKLTDLAEMVDHLEKSVGKNKSGKKKNMRSTPSDLDPNLPLVEKYHILAVKALDQPDSPIHDFQKKKQASKKADWETRNDWNDSASEWKDSDPSDGENPASGSKRKRKHNAKEESTCKRCVEMEYECKQRDSVWKKGSSKACFECWRDKKKCSFRTKKSESGDGGIDGVGNSKTKPIKQPSKQASSSKSQAGKFKSAKYIESSDKEDTPAPPKKKKKISDNNDKEDAPRAAPKVKASENAHSEGKAGMPTQEIIEIQSDRSDNDIQLLQVPQKDKIRKAQPDDNTISHKKIRREENTAGNHSGSQILALKDISDVNSVETTEKSTKVILKKPPTPTPTPQDTPQIPNTLSSYPFIFEMEKRLTVLENRQSSYEEHCADIYTQLEELKNEFEELEKSAGFQQVKIWNQDEQLNSMERSIAHHKQLADGTSSSLNRTIDLLKAVRKDVSRFQGQIDGVVERLENVEGRWVDYADSNVEYASKHDGFGAFDSIQATSGPNDASNASDASDASDAPSNASASEASDASASDTSNVSDTETEEQQAETGVTTLNLYDIETNADTDTEDNSDADAEADPDPEADVNDNANDNANANTNNQGDADADVPANTDIKPDDPASSTTGIIPDDPASSTSGIVLERKSDTHTSGSRKDVNPATSNTEGEALNSVNAHANADSNEHATESGSNMSLDSESSNLNGEIIPPKTTVLPDYKSDNSPVSTPQSDMVL
ncbi:hypothetical protein JR316_0000190 [Psilocybe cubensis]|uniref:Uncharacterized protein n=2 Tax=Psilocybe cubensis TaxID=181762 RepID=A0ACB8HDX1_PSICU|nr:hypothetical protein JR316_0000190 [Psilocybe cubensis]KAH9486126.1 hypothetical protein JR316_0000190 [Psilocybe cubensis]